MASVFETYRQRAREIDTKSRAQVEAVKQNPSWSDVGRRQQLAQIEAQRRADVERLQEEARGAAQLRKKTVDKQLLQVRADAVAKRRELLGDEVLVDLYRRRLELLSANAIGRWAQEAAEGWERAIVTEYGALELDQRAQASKGEVDREHSKAAQLLETLSAPAPDVQALEQEARELERTEETVAGFDGEAVRARDAANLGVSAKYYVPFQ